MTTNLTVRVHVIEVRNVVGKDKSGLSDPVRAPAPPARRASPAALRDAR